MSLESSYRLEQLDLNAITVTVDEAVAQIERYAPELTQSDTDLQVDVTPYTYLRADDKRAVVNPFAATKATEKVVEGIFESLGKNYPVVEQANTQPDNFASYSIEHEFRMFWTDQGKMRVAYISRFFPHDNADSLQNELPVDFRVTDKIPPQYEEFLMRRLRSDDYIFQDSHVERALKDGTTLNRPPFRSGKTRRALGKLGLKK